MWSEIAWWASDIHISLYCKKERLSSVRLYKLHENLEIMFLYHVIKCVVVCHLLYWRNILWCTLTRLACSNCFRNSLDGDIFEHAVCFFLIKNLKNIKKNICICLEVGLDFSSKGILGRKRQVTSSLTYITRAVWIRARQGAPPFLHHLLL